MKLPLLYPHFFWSSYLSCFSFSRDSLTLSSLPLLFIPGGGRRIAEGPINQCKIFALTGPTLRANALPSKGTKTCREHHEQETTNCCKLRNTKARARLALPSSSSLSRLLLPFILVTAILHVACVPYERTCAFLFARLCPCLSLSSCNFAFSQA